jgi:hypothetical protein
MNITKKAKEVLKEIQKMDTEKPELKESFDKFLEDQKEFERTTKNIEKRRDLQDYLLYGAKYVERECAQ